MSKHRKFISPAEKEIIKTEEKRQIVSSWWFEFEKSKHYLKLQSHIRHMSCFAAYVTKEYLFCSAFSSNRECYFISNEEVKEFFLITAPDYITVDKPIYFVDACTQWLLWLCRQPHHLKNAKEIEKQLNGIKHDAVSSLENAEGAASKRLVKHAISAGVDPESNDAILQYYNEIDPSGSEYYEEMLLPPHPIYNKGRMLYVFEWPPNIVFG